MTSKEILEIYEDIELQVGRIKRIEYQLTLPGLSLIDRFLLNLIRKRVQHHIIKKLKRIQQWVMHRS